MTHPLIAREGWLVLAGRVCGRPDRDLAASAGGRSRSGSGRSSRCSSSATRARVPPADADAVISPADGRIVVVEKVRDPYLEREALKISVFMNVFNVHSNKSPVDGEVKGRWYTPGSFVNADLDKASTENERNALWIQTRARRRHLVQIAGLIARRILCYVRTGDRLVRGQRYGFIRFGSRVDVYLPTTARAEVSIGQKVTGGRTILARW